MVAMATNSNITVPQKYTEKYKNVGYGWDTSHPTTISKKFIILIYHYPHAVRDGARLVVSGTGKSRRKESRGVDVGSPVGCTSSMTSTILSAGKRASSPAPISEPSSFTMSELS